jgi:arylformamidase
MSRIIDCTMLVSNRMWRSAWKVDLSVRKGETHDVEGSKMQLHLTTLHMSAHCGTHIDTPLHMIEKGPSVATLPLDRFYGEAAVVDLMDKGELYPITAQDLEDRGKHVKGDDIVLLKTGWTEKNAGGSTERMEGLPKDADYWKGPYPTRSMAEWMVERRVKAVGYDCPNEWTQHMTIEYDYMRKGSPTKEYEHVHRIHLSNGIIQIEYLCNLVSISKERVHFFAVPLKLDAEGSPVRAFAIED